MGIVFLIFLNYFLVSNRYAQMQALNDSIDSMPDGRKAGADLHSNAISANDLQQQFRDITGYSLAKPEGDSSFREFCGRAAIAQRQGISRAELAGRIEDLPGISPYYWQFFVELAEACWDSAKFGMSWKKAIRIPRRR